MNNALIESAKIGRPPAYWRTAVYLIAVIGLSLVATIAVAALVLFVLSATQVIDSVESTMVSDGFNFATTGIFEVGLIVFTLLWVLLIDRRPVPSIGLATRRPVWEWARGMLVGGGLMLLAVGVMALLGTIRLEGIVFDNPLRLLGVFGTLLFFLIQGPAEEIAFRGYLLPVLSARGTLIIGIAVSSIVFGLLHVINPNVAVLPIVNIVLAGVMFALYALVEEGLWGVFGLHSAWNWVQGNVLGLAVSGGAFGPSVLRLRESGPDWLTGGAFGPEGSLLVTLLLTGFSAWLGWRLWRKDASRPAINADDLLA